MRYTLAGVRHHPPPPPLRAAPPVDGMSQAAGSARWAVTEILYATHNCAEPSRPAWPRPSPARADGVATHAQLTPALN
eukprot:COSAG01_NODE_7018_length_3391_cov_2.202309_8_plen_78_part_00